MGSILREDLYGVSLSNRLSAQDSLASQLSDSLVGLKHYTKARVHDLLHGLDTGVHPAKSRQGQNKDASGARIKIYTYLI